MSNKNFSSALTYTRANYAHLFDASLRSITLCRQMDHRGAYGTHYCIGKESRITIANGRRSVAEFVNTLVHELTHHQQAASCSTLTRNEREGEAWCAGNLAQNNYKEQV